jgi:hypothetical protein
MQVNDVLLEQRLSQHKIARNKFIAYIKSNIEYLKRRNSILALKSSTIKYKHDTVNILTILVSTGLTCLETIKSEFDLASSDNMWIKRSSVIVPILLTSYIAISMSVLKFKRFTETLEELTKISEKLVFVVCRLRRVVEDAHMTKTIEDLQTVKTNYSKEPFDLYMNAREALDRALRFQDVVYYGKVLDKWTEDIETDVSWIKRIFCASCRKPRRRPSRKPVSRTESMLLEMGQKEEQEFHDDAGSDKSD